MKTNEPPAEVEAIIQGRIVDLSSASKFYKRTWKIYLELLSKSVTEHGPNLYEFSPQFLSEVKQQLKYILRDKLYYEPASPGDLIVTAVGHILESERGARNLDLMS